MSVYSPRTSRSWFQAGGSRYFALRQLTGVEVVSPRLQRSVQVERTTLHGTPGELRRLADELLRVANLAEIKL